MHPAGTAGRWGLALTVRSVSTWSAAVDELVDLGEQLLAALGAGRPAGGFGRRGFLVVAAGTPACGGRRRWLGQDDPILGAAAGGCTGPRVVGPLVRIPLRTAPLRPRHADKSPRCSAGPLRLVCARLLVHGGWGCVRGRYLDREIRRIIDAELVTGVHEPFDQDLFILAYIHHPDELVGEFADAGMTAATRYALEGAAWLFADPDGWLDGGERSAVLLDALRSVEQEPSLFGISSHMLTVAVVK